MDIEAKVKQMMQKVLDLTPEEIQPDGKFDVAYGVDSTEMVEISVGLKKELGLDIADSELKKTHSFNEIVEILKAKEAK